MDWFRLYHDLLTDVKVQKLPVETRWRWIELLCVASRNKVRGTLPDLDAIAYHLRTSLARAERIVKDLVEAGLIDQGEDGKGLRMHNWEGRQRKSDSSTARVQAHRERHGNELPISLGNARVTLQEHPSHVGAGAGGGAGPRPLPLSLDLNGREEGMQGEREGESSLPPFSVPDLGPEYTRLGEWAITLGADVSWGRWVLQQGHCGHSVRDIRACLEECAGAGKLTQPYAAGKLRGWAADGGRPVKKGENHGRTAVQQRPEETVSVIQAPTLEGPAGDYFRAMYEPRKAAP